MTPYERLTRLLELAEADPDCAACKEDIINAEHILEEYLESRPLEESMVCNALPVTLRLYYGRVLELVCRVMRFDEEKRDDPFPPGEAFGVLPDHSNH